MDGLCLCKAYILHHVSSDHFMQLHTMGIDTEGICVLIFVNVRISRRSHVSMYYSVVGRELMLMSLDSIRMCREIVCMEYCEMYEKT